MEGGGQQSVVPPSPLTRGYAWVMGDYLKTMDVYPSHISFMMTLIHCLVIE